MLLLSDLPMTCTAEEAATLIARHGPAMGMDGALPDVRTLRLWRTKRILSIAERHFTRRNILEALALVRLRAEGLTLARAAQRTQALDDEKLYQYLATANVTLHTNTSPTLAMTREPSPITIIQLLAAGVITLYARVRGGAVVGRSDHTMPGHETTPLELYQAMAFLGRSYFAEGMEDKAASVHQVLAFCKKPFKEWAPRVLADLAEYSETILIDPVYLVPSEECEAIVEAANGAEYSNLVERRLHEDLRRTLQTLPTASADACYTTIRGFIGRHPLATRAELNELRFDPDVPEPAFRYVWDLYKPVHASEAREGMVRRCGHCAGLIAATESACTLAGCREDHAKTKDAPPVPLAEALLAPPELLKFWVDPAREELRLYNELRKIPALRDRVRLYPHSDWCDVAVDEEVGVDVKDYRDAVHLAQRLNRSIGHLERYPTRILAIAQRRWTPTYEATLKEWLTTERQKAIQIMSIDQTIRCLRQWSDARLEGSAQRDA